MKVIIDRFEGDFAVCEKEDRSMINIERSNIPQEARPGDVLNIKDGEIKIDIEETNLRKEKCRNF